MPTSPATSASVQRSDRSLVSTSLARSTRRCRLEDLLARYPLAFADHATEFYRCAGDDPKRAWRLARDNLAARTTDRAFALAIPAARAAGRAAEAHALAVRARAMGYRISVDRCL